MERRADSIDALRGAAIILMILSGTIPFSGLGELPGWMYHAQLPPPTHKFNPAFPGITWVDLVFPFFLFSMGAAFPLAISKKLKTYKSYQIIPQIFMRGLLLAAFAIILQHFKPYAISGDPDYLVWLAGLAGFILLSAIYGRFPIERKIINYGIKAAGIAGTVVLLSVLNFRGESFSLSRSDIIILVLANNAFFGSLIWLFTRDKIPGKLLVLAILLGMRVTHGIEGSWMKDVWDATPFPWLYKFYYLQYLFIVIPGMIAGDMVRKYFGENKEAKNEEPNYKSHLLFLLSFLIIVMNTVTLYMREIEVNLILNIVLFILMFFISRGRREEGGLIGFYENLSYYGWSLVLLGLIFEPFEGGIKKDPSNLSYYFLTSGLAFFAIIFFSFITDYYRKGKILNLVIANGKNPMIAYVSISNIVMPLLVLTSLNTVINSFVVDPFTGFLKGFILTLLSALVTAYFTKIKFFWRS
jgi:predicted acyltransferase